MFSDEEIKELPESNYADDKDEIISVIEVCLDDKFDKRDLGFHGEPVLLNCSKNDLDVSRTIFEGLDQHRDGFPWVVEDSNIDELVSEPRFSGSQARFDEELEEELGGGDAKNADISSSSSAPRSSASRHGVTFTRKPSSSESRLVSSSSSSIGPGGDCPKASSSGGKVDKADPRTRMHFVKYLKRQGRTVKLWECGICAREFQHQYTLMRHLPTHTDERNFHCEVCGKSFRQLSTLSQHRAIHSSQRPYSCELCNKTFNRVSTLISHRKTHSEEKPYKCHLCPKGFHQKGNLRNHLFTHTNERPYRCDICYKGFNQQSNLVCHKLKAHPTEDPGTSSTSSSAQRIRRHYHPRMSRHAVNVPDSTKPQIEHCEVSSSVGPYLPSVDYPTSSNWPKKTPTKPGPDWSTDAYWASMTSNGVLVDPIKTYHMGVALATKQTPFALLKPDNGTPVLVKVVDMKLPSGKQMLVPATAEDLRDSGKITTNNSSDVVQDSNAVQIRVPVVATVVPRVKPGGRLHLTVEEPHYAYQAALSDSTVSVEPCSIKEAPPAPSTLPVPIAITAMDKRYGTPPPLLSCPGFERNEGTGVKPLLAWVLSQGPSPSPPLDLITLDLFDPVDGSQIPSVSNHGAAHSDEDSDIFTGKFEESIGISDSD